MVAHPSKQPQETDPHEWWRNRTGSEKLSRQERLTDCIARSRQPTPLDALVVVMMMTAARSATMVAHTRSWLHHVRAFILSDKPPAPYTGLSNPSRRRIAVLPGRACRGSDMYTTAITLANATFPDYDWMLFTVLRAT
jgi:hypothetical protein